jgi:hypothetical protein
MMENIKCTICDLPLGKGTIVGDGDGTGSRFAHKHCWDNRRAKYLDAENRKLKLIINEIQIKMQNRTGCSQFDKIQVFINDELNKLCRGE